MADGRDKLRTYMRGMNTLASGGSFGPSKTAGQYEAESVDDEYTKARQAVGQESLYTHKDYPGRADESPAERTLREGMNDHGRALEQIQKGGTIQRDQYPLNDDGDEDK